jgi:hypothetical protein
MTREYVVDEDGIDNRGYYFQHIQSHQCHKSQLRKRQFRELKEKIR